MIDFAPKSKHRMTYDEAVLYCQFLEHDGYRDWRMPTAKEYYDTIKITNSWGWYQTRVSVSMKFLWVFPVRDV